MQMNPLRPPEMSLPIPIWLGTLQKGQRLALILAAAPMSVHGQDYTLGLSSEMASTTDVSLLDSEMFVRRRDIKREMSLTLGQVDIGVDYHPSPKNLVGINRELDEQKKSAQFSWREGLDKRWEWNFSAGLYEGFTDYRSLWLDEYYRQLFANVPGYQHADVGGSNVGVGGRYEYLEASGLINWSIAWQQDEVSPAYEKIIFGPLLRGESELETWRFGLGSEHVLTPRLRFKQDAAATDTTGRVWRYNYAAETAWAVADDWTLRLRAEGTKEAEFHSLLSSLLIERDWESRWFVGMGWRIYCDNGQITDPLVISSAAPALVSYQLQLSLRYSGPQATWRLAVGPYLTRYEATAASNEQYSPLYQDRDWLAIQGSWNWRF